MKSLITFIVLFVLGITNSPASAKKPFGKNVAMTVSITGNTSACQGASVGYSAVVFGNTGTPIYQWKKNGINVTPDVTGTPANVGVFTTLHNNDVISCFVATTTGQSATSNSITITITQPSSWSTGFSFTPGPTLCQNTPVTFTTTSGLSSYQWSMNGSAVVGATSSSFNTTAISVTQLQSVSVTATTSASCVTSGAATSSATGIPFVVNPSVVTPAVPSGTLTRCQGAGTSQFSTTVNSQVSYDWSIANAGSSFTSGSGSTGTVTWDPNFSGTAVVSVQSSSTCGTSAPASCSVTINPTITYSVNVSGPSQSCFDLSAVNFTAIVNNNQSSPALGTLGYKWFVDGVVVSGNNPVPGSNGVNLVSNITTSVRAGSLVYCVAYTNVAGCVVPSVTSATYIVPTPAALVTPTASIGVPRINYCQGDPITFTASSAYIGGSSTYTWRKNGGAYLGTSNSITLNASTDYGNGTFSLLDVVTVEVTNLAGECVNSTTATGTTASIPIVITPSVTPAISIHGDDVSKPVCLGTSFSFVATVTNGGNAPSLQWRVNGSNVASATGNSFTTTAINNGQQVDCVLTSNATCANPTTPTSTPMFISTLSPVGTPGAITGPSSTKQQGTSLYSASASDASSYNWAINPPNAGSIASDGTVTWSNENIFSTATVSVTANGCNGPSAVSTLQVTLLPPLSGGVILSGNVTINPGNNPGRIVASPAYGGSCNGNYQYQWQQSNSDSGPFTDMPGSTGKTCLPGAVSTITYFRRKATCGSDITFTNVIVVKTGTSNATNQNYVRERDITRSGITDFTAAAQLTDPHDVRQTTSYFDGLGAPLQTVAKQASPLANDMVSTHAYDPFQRESVTLLGYTDAASDGDFKGNAASDQYNFNKTQFPSEQYYYNQTDFETSPLGRPLATHAPGASWVGAGRGVLAQYLTNTETDSVLIWSIDIATGGLPVSPGTYPAGQLYKNVSIDEHGYQTVEYKDKNGHLILKKVQLALSPNTGHKGWACTYYIYDDLDNLVVVLPPEAINSALSVLTKN